jgi:hypothetical protein
MGGETLSRIRAWRLIHNKKMLSLRKLPGNCEVRANCICQELPVILVNRAVDKKRMIRKNGWPRRRKGTS